MKKAKRALNKTQYRNMLDDLCSDYCEEHHYCILKEFLVSSHPSPRLLIQMKCIDKFKYELGKEEDRKIDWAEALNEWVDRGYAEKFADNYEEGKNFRTIYKEVTQSE